MSAESTQLDQIAQRIAAQAGVRWEDLNEHPGYTRNYWRSEAKSLLAAISPTALLDALPPRQ